MRDKKLKLKKKKKEINRFSDCQAFQYILAKVRNFDLVIFFVCYSYNFFFNWMLTFKTFLLVIFRQNLKAKMSGHISVWTELKALVNQVWSTGLQLYKLV